MPDRAQRKMPAPRPPRKTELIAIRVSPQDRQAIEALAADRGMTITSLLTDAALGRLDESFVSAEQLWRAEVERRLERLEDFAYGA